MSTEENKQLVRRQFDEVWNGANWATVDELYAPNYVNHDPYNPNQGTGPEGFTAPHRGGRSYSRRVRPRRRPQAGPWLATCQRPS